MDEGVLPIERFVVWREEGLSFAVIGERIGYSGGAVGAYGREVLPEHLQKRRAGKGKLKNGAAANGPLERLEQIRAEIHEERVKAEERKRRELEGEKKKVTRKATARKKKQPTRPIVPVEIVPASETQIPTVPMEVLDDKLVLVAGDNGTAAAVVAGPEGLLALGRRRRKETGWQSFLEAAGEELDTIDPLAQAVPPAYVRTDEDRWEYLQQIAIGNVWVAQGKRVRRRLRRILARLGRPVLSRGTTRALTMLASTARWLIARERSVQR